MLLTDIAGGLRGFTLRYRQMLPITLDMDIVSSKLGQRYQICIVHTPYFVQGSRRKTSPVTIALHERLGRRESAPEKRVTRQSE